MSKPSRNSDPGAIRSAVRTFFVSTCTTRSRHLLQSEQSAGLLMDVLRHYTVEERKMRIHEFVIMPTHLHLLLTIDGETTIEKAVQLIKGNYSFRRKKELGYIGELWQRGFSEVRVYDTESFSQHKKYIDENSVKAGLAESAEEYPYCSAFLRKKRAAAAKAGN